MRWNLPNMILLAGNGRNVGKTTFALLIIRHLSKYGEVFGLKTSPHMHDLNEDLEVLIRTSDYVVAEEKGQSKKDSSLMLQAGAKKVFFIMAKDEFLEQAFSVITKKLEGTIVVAESGGLSPLIKPGIFFFVKHPKDQIIKKHYLEYKPIMVNNDDPGFDFKVERLSFKNKHIFKSQAE
jgi:hypothetical protein